MSFNLDMISHCLAVSEATCENMSSFILKSLTCIRLKGSSERCGKIMDQQIHTQANASVQSNAAIIGVVKTRTSVSGMALLMHVLTAKVGILLPSFSTNVNPPSVCTFI